MIITYSSYAEKEQVSIVVYLFTSQLNENENVEYKEWRRMRTLSLLHSTT